METIKFDKWVIEADVEKTREYSEKTEKCSCLPCQNFRKQIEKYNDKLTQFLIQFGVDPMIPEECVWFDGDRDEQKVIYLAYYVVEGEIKEFDQYEIDIDYINIVLDNGEINSMNTNVQNPYFVISVYNIYMDWMLDEDYNDVFSAVNEVKRKRMLNKVLKKLLFFLKKKI